MLGTDREDHIKEMGSGSRCHRYLVCMAYHGHRPVLPACHSNSPLTPFQRQASPVDAGVRLKSWAIDPEDHVKKMMGTVIAAGRNSASRSEGICRRYSR